jgi:hypothetical protein
VDDLLGSFRWYDTLCINQDDLSEKSQQVLYMRDIYETLIWLGEAADESELAFRFITAWAIANKEDFNDFLEEYPFAFDAEAREAVDKLFKRPWWRRIWVYQGFVLSNSVMFLCGSNYIPYEVLINARKSWETPPSSATNFFSSTGIKNSHQYRTWKRTASELDRFGLRDARMNTAALILSQIRRKTPLCHLSTC